MTTVMKKIMNSFRVVMEQENNPILDDDFDTNIELAISKIKELGYDWKMVPKKANWVKVLHDDRLEALDALEKKLVPHGFVHNPDFGHHTLGRIEIFGRKPRGNAFILLKRGTGSPAGEWREFEDKVCNYINQNYGDLGIDARCAGSGHGNDIEILGPKGRLDVEMKKSLAADFPQFTLQFNLNTGKWEPRRTLGYMKNEILFQPVFEELLADYLNNNAVFPDFGDPRLKIDKDNKVYGIRSSTTTKEFKQQLENSWFNGKTGYRANLNSDIIGEYYRKKGNVLIQLGKRGLYALTDEIAKELDIPRFRDLGLQPYVRLRLKPVSKGNSPHSFTAAIKATGGDRSVKTNMSLQRPKDIDKVISIIL